MACPNVYFLVLLPPYRSEGRGDHEEIHARTRNHLHETRAHLIGVPARTLLLPRKHRVASPSLLNLVYSLFLLHILSCTHLSTVHDNTHFSNRRRLACLE